MSHRPLIHRTLSTVAAVTVAVAALVVPAQAAQPTEPTGPTEPTEPAEPAELTEPIELAEPTEVTQAAQPADSVQAAQATDPATDPAPAPVAAPATCSTTAWSSYADGTVVLDETFDGGLPSCWQTVAAAGGGWAVSAGRLVGTSAATNASSTRLAFGQHLENYRLEAKLHFTSLLVPSEADTYGWMAVAMDIRPDAASPWSQLKLRANAHAGAWDGYGGIEFGMWTKWEVTNPSRANANLPVGANVADSTLTVEVHGTTAQVFLDGQTIYKGDGVTPLLSKSVGRTADGVLGLIVDAASVSFDRLTVTKLGPGEATICDHATDSTCPIVPATFQTGVTSHISDGGQATRADGQTDMAVAVAELGANSIRTYVTWPMAEPTGYDYPAGYYEERMTLLGQVSQNGGKAILILDKSNQNHVAWGFPNSDQERQAFVNYAHNLVTDYINRYGVDSLGGFEIWNEWNWLDGWQANGGAKPNPYEPCQLYGRNESRGCPIAYAELVEAVVPTLRQLAPNVPIIVGGTSNTDIGWMRPMLAELRQRGVHVDGVSVHPYGNLWGCDGAAAGPPCGSEYLTRQFIDVLWESYGASLPVYITEVGWSTPTPALTDPDDLRLVDQPTQARYLVEAYARLRSVATVQGVYWYTVRNDTHLSHYEHYFGLLEADFGYKPAATALQSLANFWAGCTSEVGMAPYFTLTCPGGERRIVLDATAAQLQQALAQGWTVVDLLGQYAAVTPGSQLPAGLAGHHVGLRSQAPQGPSLGQPVLSGTPVVGQVLTVAVPQVTPAGAAVTRVWYRGTSVIAGATGTSYTLTAAEAGQDICVKVTVTYAGQAVTKYSNHLIVAQGLSLTQPVLAGQAVAGALVSVSAAVAPAGAAAVTYQWFRDTSLIAGVSGPTYVLQAADGGKGVKVKVTATYAGQTVTKYSNALWVLGISRLEVQGTARVGYTLQLDGRYEPSDAVLEIKWYRGTSVVGTGLTYRLQAADAGQDLVVKATVSKAGLGTVSKYSAHFWPTS
ncbi:MAG: glycoside hydrolase family 5 protein [Bifidobacteriaceae bacterium]|jgi:hypothetical protein|nr:glycoside hydrolase family 5 protein [Bifidobacteriaceae bacterium]